MIILQEIITRGRFIFSNAPGRLDVFELINGKRNTQDIASELKRHVNNIRRDIITIHNAELIQAVLKNGEPVKKDGFPVFEKIPLARTIHLRYFIQPSKLPKVRGHVIPIKTSASVGSAKSIPSPLTVPSEQDILIIANLGEDQLYEFKAQGTYVQKISKEICAMLNTQYGGMILYGIDDDGTIEGSDKSKQEFDQPLQNSVRNSISPAASVQIHPVDVMGSEILVIIVPPWNRKDVYQIDGKVLIRRGTNAFAAKPEEIRSLHEGKYVI